MSNYIVEAGDTIASIAKKFGVKVASLVRENHLENVYYLEPGLELIVPNESEKVAFDYYTVKKGDTIFIGNNE